LLNSKEYHHQWYLNNRERINKRHIQYYKDNCEKTKKYNRQWKKDNPKKVKSYTIKANYNLSYEDWSKMWESQNGRCAICEKPFTKPSDAYVDHNHQTNKVRSLLCMKCNIGIGIFNDSPKLTAKVTEYLLRYTERIKK